MRQAACAAQDRSSPARMNPRTTSGRPPVGSAAIRCWLRSSIPLC